MDVCNILSLAFTDQNATQPPGQGDTIRCKACTGLYTHARGPVRLFEATHELTKSTLPQLTATFDVTQLTVFMGDEHDSFYDRCISPKHSSSSSAASERGPRKEACKCDVRFCIYCFWTALPHHHHFSRNQNSLLALNIACRDLSPIALSYHMCLAQKEVCVVRASKCISASRNWEWRE